MRDELVEQIVAAPDDLALRLVLADALVEAGDRRGEHIHLEAAGLRAQAAALAAELPPRHPLLALTWRLGFIERAAVIGDALDVVALLLRHPAARLVEVLSVSVEAGERVRLAALVAARPRPSLLRRLEIGAPAIGRQWLGQADADYVAPVARTAGVATVVTGDAKLIRAIAIDGRPARVQSR